MSGVFLFLTLSFILPGLICFRFVCVLFSTLLKPFSVTISKVKAQTITLLYSDCVLWSLFPPIALLKMERDQDNIVALVKQHPDGIPLKKLAVFYNQAYHKNLTISSLGFDSMSSLVASLDRDLVVERELVFHKSHHHARSAGTGTSTKATKDSKNTKVFENIVAMVQQHSAGIPLKKMAVSYSQTYHKNLTLSTLGFDSMASLLASLDRDLILEGELVFHKDHYCESQAGASAKATEDIERIDEVLKNIMDMMKEHPEGIPLKKVAIVYSQKYRHNLALASLGFTTISCLVAYLKGDLVVRGEVVFHKIHWPPSQPVPEYSTKVNEDSRPATPQRTESQIITPSVTVPQVDVTSDCVPTIQAAIPHLGPPLCSLFSTLCPVPVNTRFTVPKQAKELTQQQLYQRVIEVSFEDKYVDHRVFCQLVWVCSVHICFDCTFDCI